MRIIVDMNLSPSWLPLLSGAGHEALHWSQCGPADAPDAQIMDYAKANDCVILTHDLDFGMLLAARSETGPSVIQIRAADLAPAKIGDLVLRTLALVHREIDHGALVTIDAAQARLRILPIDSSGAGP